MTKCTSKLYNGDCIATMAAYVPDKSVDMVLTDLPYGITDCKWDSMIPFPLLWEQFLRVIKDDGAIALTAAQPFTAKLIQSQPKLFRYCWYWIKNQTTGFAFAKKQPMRCVEEVCIFYRKAPTYNPQGLIELDKPILCRGRRKTAAHGESVYRSDGSLGKDTLQHFTNYPRQTLNFKCERGLHPTQKPVALCAYQICTYTDPGDTVLDACMGSGTTGVACAHTGRNFIGIEIEETTFQRAKVRIGKEEQVRT